MIIVDLRMKLYSAVTLSPLLFIFWEILTMVFNYNVVRPVSWKQLITRLENHNEITPTQIAYKI
jgi:hypothetical protein